MRNFIIGGVPRSGKSTISKRLSAEKKLSHIPVDSLVSTFGKIYPEIGISHYGDSFNEMCAQLWPFLKEYLNQIDYEDIGYVVDAYHIRPRDIVESMGMSGHQVLFMGYPAIPIEHKVKEIRNFSREQDWTEDISDQELITIVKRLIEESRTLQRECQEYGLKFVDTGQNYSRMIEIAFQELMGNTLTA